MKKQLFSLVVSLWVILGAVPVHALLSFDQENERHCRSCHGDSTSDFHHLSYRAITTGCLGCHPRSKDGSIAVPIQRSCKKCHVNSGVRDPFTGLVKQVSPHHGSGFATLCTTCHTAPDVSYVPYYGEYGGSPDPAPEPIVSEPTTARNIWPVQMAGVSQTFGMRDVSYESYVAEDCRMCHGTITTGSEHHESYWASLNGCTSCHPVQDGKTLPTERDCKVCHVNPGGSNPITGVYAEVSPHHDGGAARGGACHLCHEGVEIQGSGTDPERRPWYQISMLTPSVDSCLNCHNGGEIPGPRGFLWSPVGRSHHAASNECGFCHEDSIEPIRKCQSCHTLETLHSIPGHTSDNSRCIGCHGGYLATQPPAMRLSTLKDYSTTDNPILNIAGTVFSNTGLGAFAINGKGVPLAEDGSFSYAVQLQPGENSVHLAAPGINGQVTEEIRTITYITTLSGLTLSSPADNTVTAQGEILIQGTVAGPGSVALAHNEQKEEFLPLSRGKFSARISLVPGLNTFEISRVHKSGKRVTRKRTVIYDPSTPSLAVNGPAQDQVSLLSDISLSGSAAGSSEISVYKDGVPVSTFSASGPFTVPISFTTEKMHQIKIDIRGADGKKTTVQRNILYCRPK